MRGVAFVLALLACNRTTGGTLNSTTTHQRDDARPPDSPQAATAKSIDAAVHLPHEQSVDVAAAVESAERFIGRNGYTDALPDRSALSYETIEWSSNVDELLARRHDTLQPRACGYFREAWRWIICFKHRKIDARGAGRGVSVDLNGIATRVEHQAVRLQACHPMPNRSECSK